jgi:hypothetical protein
MRIKSLSSKIALVGAMSAVGILGTGATAFASSTSTATQTATITSGSLSVAASAPGTISVPVAGTSIGSLPASVWANDTGSETGWTGSVAASNLTYTGQWVASSGATALTTTAAGAYTGTQDGLSMTATVTGTDTVQWTTNTPVCSGCANITPSATYTPGTALALSNGITINLPSGVATGSSYTVEFGTQASGAMSLTANPSDSSVTDASGNTDPPPSLILSTLTPLTAPASGSSFGTPVAFLSAAANVDQGMGSFNVTPGFELVSDQNSWAGNYVANIEYSIASGPTA